VAALVWDWAADAPKIAQTSAAPTIDCAVIDGAFLRMDQNTLKTQG